jgi:alkylation response protein AidB-like acyl-CoA dehydrogenase
MRVPAEEVLEFGTTVRELLVQHNAVAMTRSHADDADWNRGLWNELRSMGVTELVADREYGALAEVAEALGAYPATVPVLASAILVPALLQSLDADAIDDDRIRAIGPFDGYGRLGLSALEITGAGHVIGAVPLALQAAWADELVVAVPHNGTIALLLVDLSDAAVAVRPRTSLDVTTPFADVTLDGAPARVLATTTTDKFYAAIDGVEAIGSLWLGAGEVGTAQRLLDLAVAYALDRVQFGMPIGARQAIKHKCADMLMQIESARSALWAAASTLLDAADSREGLAVLRLASDRAVDFAAQQSFQIHGGIGFTWEHDLHFLFKRAMASRGLLGGPAHQRSILDSQLLEGA